MASETCDITAPYNCSLKENSQRIHQELTEHHVITPAVTELSGFDLTSSPLMSPSSLSYTVGKVKHGELQPAPSIGSRSATTSFQFGLRSRLHHQAEKVSVSALKVCKDSHRIRKPPLPLPRPAARAAGLHPTAQLRSPVQYRAPIIIHTYSPEVIYTQPDDFMSLVQKLTGSCDTRHRLKRKPSKKGGAKKSPRPRNDPPVSATVAVNAAVTALEQQEVADLPGSSLSSSVLNCGSPSSSEEDLAIVRDGLASVKQSNSPRGPLSNFEFESSFAPPVSEAPSSSGNTNVPVKTEPVNLSDSFNFLTGLKPLPKPENGLFHSYFHSSDINSPLPSPGFLSPGLFAGLPELSPGTAAWSQQFLDCLNGSPQLVNQPPLQTQRASGTGGASEGTMVALENIQAFMLT